MYAVQFLRISPMQTMHRGYFLFPADIYFYRGNALIFPLCKRNHWIIMELTASWVIDII